MTASVFERFNQRLPTCGLLALAAFTLATVTGVLLAIPFDVGAATDSLQLLELSSPASRLLRALHGWSGNLFVLFTLLHVVEQLLAGGEQDLRRGVWLRLTASVPISLFLMLSGFLLKGDAEGVLARQILAGLLEKLPWLGSPASTSLLGGAGDLQLIYVHHAATATIITGVLVVEHARRVWPGVRSFVVLTLVAGILSVLAPPTLHDPLDPDIKGPWYFVGVQEILHWLSRPGWIWLAAAFVLGLFASLPSLPSRWNRRGKRLLWILLLCYGLVSVWALGCRGPGWRIQWPGLGEGVPGSQTPARTVRPMIARALAADTVPRVLGHREGCLACHSQVTGLSPSHEPSALGCYSCHLGDPFAADADQAHAGMVRVPGNLDTAALSCGQSGCHGAIVTRVRTSLMATGRGMVAVDRFIFGEADSPDGVTPIARLGDSAADLHLKGLCINCHLGTLKPIPAPINEDSRGGGCTACHLGYAKEGKGRFSRKTGRDPNKNAQAFVHPSLTVQVTDDHCFGCHSRSGRISLNYAGWSETLLEDKEIEGKTPGKYRVLQDGRVLQQQKDDIHHQQGMACVDCHTSREAMGDGKQHKHQEQAVEVSCEDCHPRSSPSTATWAELDPETRAIITLRQGRPAEERFVLSRRTGKPLLNVLLDSAGQVKVRSKLGKRTWQPKRPVSLCGEGVSGHERLTCQSCHSAWAPQCVSCHTQYTKDGQTADPLTNKKLAGRFVEYQGEPRAEPPALGVRHGSSAGKDRVEPFVPGMIITLNTPNKGQVPAGPPPASADKLVDGSSIFHRLYAPVAPHTSTHKGRSCASCHNEPLALGLGRGKLELVGADGEAVSWKFTPAFEITPRDGLPADAWTGFGQGRQGLAATRTDARPFNPQEQHRILRVGACITCHDPTDAKHSGIYRDFQRSLKRVSPRCLVPGAGVSPLMNRNLTGGIMQEN